MYTASQVLDIVRQPFLGVRGLARLAETSETSTSLGHQTAAEALQTALDSGLLSDADQQWAEAERDRHTAALGPLTGSMRPRAGGQPV